jgi:formylglycine-generating enzyme required for sulfatase activity
MGLTPLSWAAVLHGLVWLSAHAAQPANPDATPQSCCSTGGRLAAILASSPAAQIAPPPGMVWIEGGEFLMGSTDPLARPDEQPIHRVRVDGFWIDETEVTNTQFRAFVEATGYLTVAERAVDWEELKKQVPEGTPKPPEELLLPGSLVFTPPDHAVNLGQHAQWWTWTTGANWRHPGVARTAI